MWTATILDKNFINGMLEAQVEFSDGVDSSIENIKTASPTDFKNWIKTRCTNLQSAKEFATTLTVGKYEVPEEIVEPVVEPTKEEIALQAKLVKKFEITRMVEDIKRQKEAEILAVDNPELAAKLESLNADVLVKEVIAMK
jgi:hypothetical protein